MSAAIETTRSVTLRPWQASAQDRITLIVLPVKPQPPKGFER